MLKTFSNRNYSNVSNCDATINFDDFQFMNLSNSIIKAQSINDTDNDMISQEIIPNDFTTYITDSFDLSLLPPTTTTHTEFNNFNQLDDKSNIPQILIHPTLDLTNTDQTNTNTNFTEYRNIKDEPHLLSPCYYSVSSPDSYSNISSPVSYCGSTSSTASSLINIFDEVQIFNDIFPPSTNSNNNNNEPKSNNNDHQLLRQVLKDMSFQKKHNIKTLDIDLGDFHEIKNVKETRTTNETLELEPVLSLAMQQMKEDVKRTCTTLSISLDIKQWTCQHTESWLKWALMQLGFGTISLPTKITTMNGKQLSSLNEMELIAAIGNFELGSTIFAQLEIWKAACQDVTLDQQQQQQIMEEYRNNWLNTTSNTKESTINQTRTINKSQIVLITSSAPASPNHSDEILNPNKTLNPITNNTTGTNRKIIKRRRTSVPLPTLPPETSIIDNNDLIIDTTNTSNKQQNSHIHLWQFLKELLESPQTYGNCIRWIEQKNGVFKIEDSLGVAQLWGKRKNRPAMNYDKLSRSIRQYYKKGIMKKTEKSQRLVYQFCRPYFN